MFNTRRSGTFTLNPLAAAAVGRRVRFLGPLVLSLLPVALLAPQVASAGVFATVKSDVWQDVCTWFVCNLSPPPGAGIPGGGDTASVKHYVTFGTEQDVGTLVLTGTLTGGTLNILDAGFWNSGTFGTGIYNNRKTLSIVHAGNIGIYSLQGTINNPFGSTVSQSSTYQMNNAGTVNNHGYYGISNDSDIGNSVSLGPVINNYSTGVFEKAGGTATSLISGNIDFNNQGGTITAKAGTLQIGNLSGNSGLLEAEAGATIQLVGTNLAGTYTGSGGGTVELSDGFQGTATFDMPGALLNWTNGTIKGVLINVGTLGITGGSVPFLTGTIHNGMEVSTGVINQSGRYSMTNDGVLNNKGTYNLLNDDASITNSVSGAPKINNHGSFVKTGGTGKSSVAADIEFNNRGGTIAAQTGTLEIGKLTGSGGTLNAADGATLVIASGQLAGAYEGSGAGTVRLGNGIFDGIATFNLPGSLLQWAGGTIKGAYANNVALAITGDGHLQGTLNNNGVINQSASFTIVPGGTGTLSNIGTFNITTDAGILNSSSSGPRIVNTDTGRFAKTGGLLTSSVSTNIIFENQGGTIAAETGILSIEKLIGSGGILNAAPGATLRIRSANLTGTYTGSGGGTVALDGGLQGAATFTMPGSLLKWTGGDIVGALTNKGNLGIVTGAGRLTGGSIVNQGDIAQSASFSMFNNGTLLENSGTYQITNDSNINGGSAGPVFRNTASGRFAKTGGSLTSSVSTNIIFENQGGTIAAESGILSFEKLTGSGGILIAATGATLQIRSANLTGTYTGSGDGTVELGGGFQGTATFDMPGSLLKWTGGDIVGALTNKGNLGIVTGAGRLTGGSITNQGLIAQSARLSMTNNGTLLVNSGTYQITNDSDIGNGVSGTPVFRNAATGSFAKTAGTGTSTVSGVEFDNWGHVTVHSGTLDLANVTQHPTGSTLTGGSWAVMAGATLSVSSGNNIVINQGNVSLSGVGSTFLKINALADNQGAFAILDGRNFTTAGKLQNSGTLTVGQGSVLTIKAGSVLNSSGTIHGGGSIVGSVVSSGTVGPGTSIGTLAIDGDLTLEGDGAGGVLEIEIASASSFDVLTVSGLAGLGGALKVDLLPGYVPHAGDSFKVLTFASYSGAFDSYLLPKLGGGLYLQHQLNVDNLTLTVAVPEPGTYGMMIFGLGLLGWRFQRQRACAAAGNAP